MDVWPVIAEGGASPRHEILHSIEPTRAAIRVENYKLIVTQNRSKDTDHRAASESTELFDIAADPNEKQDLAERHPEIVRRLRDRLEEYRRQAVPPRNDDRGNPPPGFKVPAVWGEFEKN
jgi:hypothetical protein